MKHNNKNYPVNLFTICPLCAEKTIKNSNKSIICVNCSYEYFFNPAPAVACLLFNNKNELLLTKRAINPGIGLLDLPGGFVDPMESAETAVIREIKEELNIDLTSIEYLCSEPNTYMYKDILYYTCDLAFIGKCDSFDNIKPQDDVADLLFLKIQEIDFTQVGFSSIKNIIQFYMNKYTE